MPPDSHMKITLTKTMTNFNVDNSLGQFLFKDVRKKKQFEAEHV